MWVTSPTTWTATNWSVGCSITECTLATRTVDNARVKALVFYTGSIIWAVNVMLTFTSLDYKENSSVFFSLPFFGVVRWSFFLVYKKSSWRHCKQISTLRELQFGPRSDLKVDPSYFNGYSSRFYSIEPISKIGIVCNSNSRK